jgi:hypothetical protein
VARMRSMIETVGTLGMAFGRGMLDADGVGKQNGRHGESV